MAKREISWKRRTETGERLEVCAHRVGDRWSFYERERRSQQWRVVHEPPLVDWLELFDAVCRRTGRQLLRAEEEERLKKMIRERFPEANLQHEPE